MKVIVVDVEQTCWPHSSEKFDRLAEIIEIGAVRVDLSTGQILDSWQSLIRPTRHPNLSDYCQELTGITQADLKGKPRFREAYAHFVRFCGGKHLSILAGWGADNLSLERSCGDNQTLMRHPVAYWNVSHMYSARFDMPSTNLKKAVEAMNLSFEGDPHRALPDAMNTARLLARLFHPTA